MPIPPSRAIAIAMSDSVTVSMALETSGIESRIRRVRLEDTFVSLGITVECAGKRSTSSYVMPRYSTILESGVLRAKRPFVEVVLEREAVEEEDLEVRLDACVRLDMKNSLSAVASVSFSCKDSTLSILANGFCMVATHMRLA